MFHHSEAAEFFVQKGHLLATVVGMILSSFGPQLVVPHAPVLPLLPSWRFFQFLKCSLINFILKGNMRGNTIHLVTLPFKKHFVTLFVPTMSRSAGDLRSVYAYWHLGTESVRLVPENCRRRGPVGWLVLYGSFAGVSEWKGMKPYAIVIIVIVCNHSNYSICFLLLDYTSLVRLLLLLLLMMMIRHD